MYRYLHMFAHTCYIFAFVCMYLLTYVCICLDLQHITFTGFHILEYIYLPLYHLHTPAHTCRCTHKH